MTGDVTLRNKDIKDTLSAISGMTGCHCSENPAKMLNVVRRSRLVNEM